MGVGGTTRSGRKRRKMRLFAGLIKKWIYFFFLKVVMQSDCIYETKELVPRSCFVATCIINMDEGQTVLTQERMPRIEVELIHSGGRKNRSFTFLSVIAIYEKGDKKLLLSP